VLPKSWVKKHHTTTKSGWQKVHTNNQNVDRFKNEKGIELIAEKLRVPYPTREAIAHERDDN
jgi:hypothetical protein